MPTGSKKITPKIKMSPKSRVKNMVKKIQPGNKKDSNVTKLPKVLELTTKTRDILHSNWRLFALLLVTYCLAFLFLGGITSESTYSTVKSEINSSFSSYGGVLSAAVLSLNALLGGISGSGTTQQVYATILLAFSWLTVVWILRNLMAGKKFKLRDALYNAGSPILSTILVGLALMLDLLPATLGIIIYYAASSSGFLSNVIAAIVVVFLVLLLTVLSIYWLVGTLFGMVVVALPGVYPVEAIKTGFHLVSGKRVAILKRLLWLLLTILIGWLIILTPLILFDNWAKSAWSLLSAVPFIPGVVIILTGISLIWAFSYFYIFYREMVDNDERPAKN